MKDWSEQLSGMSNNVSKLIRMLNDRKYEDALLMVIEMRADLGKVRDNIFDKMDYKLFDTVEFYKKANAEQESNS